MGEILLADAVASLPDAQKDTKSKSGTKRYFVLLLAVVVAIASILLVFHLLSNNNVAVPEEGIYVVGEKMTYNRTVTYDVENNTNTFEYKSVIEVLGFDGENYNLEYTSWLDDHEISITMKTNLKGEIIELQGGYAVDPENSSSSFFPVYGDEVKFNSENVIVGDSWSVPLVRDIDNTTVRGTIHYTFSETTTVTVPAGTYDVIKIEAEISDFEASGPIGENEFQSTRNITGYILLEESTHKVIEYKKVDFASMISDSQTLDGITTTFYQIVKHTK